MQAAPHAEAAAHELQMRGRDLRLLRLSGAGQGLDEQGREDPPKRLLGAAWEPQRLRMEAGIYFPLFLVLATPKQDFFSIHYLAADLQDEGMFLPREPLSVNAKRAGWRGFNYNLEAAGPRLIHVTEGRLPLARPGAADVTY
jgi:hypothetical protein